ncbi:MAG: ABC transporter permease [Chloroflexota bacterium]|jgi:peptide/nickel transport system permease protein
MIQEGVIVRRHGRWNDVGKGWYKFSSSKLSVVGLAIVAIVVLLAIFAPLVAPYPQHAGAFVDFGNANRPPGSEYLMGTDNVGRDILSRLIFSLRSALLMGIVVLSIAVPVGSTLGLIAGYFRGTVIDAVITRITDVFLAVPPLVLALAIASMLTPNLTNAMIAISVMWWPWYTRLVYGMASSLSKEYFVRSAELSGGGWFHIIIREILPNCVSPILTKMTLDMGIVIMVGASISFVGLGEQPPAPALGNMVSDGAKYMPEQWWMTVFPALAIMMIVLGFNLLGDGIRDLFAVEDKN